ncbi:MAG: precorrin-8X methylmutase [Nitrososphaeraceae archaeon]|nr:precorrin-8X methylmutase [Nitrososphaeraceae archaeon]
MVTIKSAASNESPENRSMSIRSFDIEKTSFKIIEESIQDHTYELQYEWPIVRRVIHATADFDFATKEKIIFNHSPIISAFKAIQNGSHIITDVEMVRAGISKINLKKLNLESVCKITDQTIMEEAKKYNKTRAEMAMLSCREEMDGGVVVIGNAPTALYETIRMIKENLTKPSVVIGVPVGFVSALESKTELLKTNIPSITNLGRKGGSSVASSIINALLLLYLQIK